MITKLEEPILMHAESEFTFMIAEYVEIEPLQNGGHISYYGKVYNYDDAELTLYNEGQWVYDVSLNIMLSKDENGNYD
ncbi:hypothetical protein J2Z83_003775 [Virgibacillus natechei]|uniref:DUF5348 domain-containing protein n=1 Tax=Virgibacillus natechei TaxID=1216297 RepID=A0ABS4IL26_9BACI|nr:hypothetical protein [Virgibacillus natechei]MBP1971624.1 hypothetical protein [Virgibacillus natechei]UZD13049.1 hypothetical protein OLD84_00270 [Virgibacillus natechei]